MHSTRAIFKVYLPIAQFGQNRKLHDFDFENFSSLNYSKFAEEFELNGKISEICLKSIF